MSASIVEIRLDKENFKFSSGHFTIFSATERENLHGHNFNVAAAFTCEVIHNGMTFDYGLAKRAVEKVCRSLNEYFLIPQHSPYLKVEDAGHSWQLTFNGESFAFLKRDALVLPVANITVEELAGYILDQLWNGFAADPEHRIKRVSIEVRSGPGQGAAVSRDAS